RTRAVGLLVLATLLVPLLAVAAPEVEPVDWTLVQPEQFSDEEMDTPPHAFFPLPYYLAHLHEVANSIRTDEPNRGFIDISVWRTSRYNVPENIRIMENVLS